MADKWRFTADSVNLAVMPMFHIAGSGWAMVGLYCRLPPTSCCATSTRSAILEADSATPDHQHACWCPR